MIDEYLLISFAKQMLREQNIIVDNIRVASANDYAIGVKDGIERIIKLIERQKQYGKNKV